ncbi:MAG: hypothetical protein V4447_01470 [Pseudomonadota bacterium]
MKLATILLLIGVAILGYAASIAPYKNEALFMERYMALSSGQNTEYSKLREEMLTLKFQLQDYGGTLVSAAIVTFLISRKGWRNMKSPKSRATLLGLAFVVPFFTVGAFVLDLFLGFERGEFPHWADSMGIPLSGSPFLLVILLVWSGAHLAFLSGTYMPAPLSQAASKKANKWLQFIAALTAVLVALCASFGQYWYAMPGIASLYLYLSLAAARCATSAAEPTAPEGRAASGASLS